MIEISNKYNCILSFDGRVVEDFGLNSSKRIHVRQVKSVQVKEKKKGYLVSVFSHGGSSASISEVDHDQRGAIDQLVAALDAARPGEIEFK